MASTDYAVILAARMASQRLPGKALASYTPDGTPNLEQIARRWQSSDRAPRIVITTTDSPDDDPIAALGKRLGLPVSRGSATNVVAQMDKALRTFAPDARFVARALGDNPLVDIGLADWRLDVLAETGADGLWYGGDEARLTYAATTDVWSRPAWDRIVAESSGSQLEHPGQWYWDHISKFNAVQLPLPRREYLAAVKTELDTELDLDMLRTVWRAWASPSLLPALWALGYLATHPTVAALNAGVPVKTQSRAVFPAHFKAWVCENCQQRGGSIVEGNLRIYCVRCGRPHSFFAHKPQRRLAAS